jgi:hypothetical protein
MLGGSQGKAGIGVSCKETRGTVTQRPRRGTAADFTQLNQDHQARMQGAQRQQDFSGWRDSGQSARDFGDRSFGSGGGGFEGGRFGGGGFGVGRFGGGGFRGGHR